MIKGSRILTPQQAIEDCDAVTLEVPHRDRPPYEVFDRKIHHMFGHKDNSWKRRQKAPKRFGTTDKIINHLEDVEVA